jgi:hypothetical protein
MNKEKLLSIINKYVGYAEQEIYDAVAEYEEEKISFAKKHCEAALKAASEKAEIKIKDNYSESYFLVKSETVNYNSCGVYNVYAEECTKHNIEVFDESILNAYPLTNIT